MFLLLLLESRRRDRSVLEVDKGIESRDVKEGKRSHDQTMALTGERMALSPDDYQLVILLCAGTKRSAPTNDPFSREKETAIESHQRGGTVG